MIACLLIVILYPYAIYPLLLIIIRYAPFSIKRRFDTLSVEPDGLTVFLSLYNEEKIIYKRLENIAQQNFQHPLEILLVLDGCSDKSLEEIDRFRDAHADIDISIFSEESNKGQANSQNIAGNKAKYNVLLKTDSETIFKKGLLNNIYTSFLNLNVGVVGGGLDFISSSSFAKIYQIYFDYEQWLRRLESDLGYGVKVSGACAAYRKEIWESIESFEDVDQVITFMAEKNHLQVKLLPENDCLEVPNTKPKRELVARSRMTAKGIKSIRKHLTLDFIKRHPVFSIFMCSHKLIRYLSSPAALVLILALIYQLGSSYPFYSITGAVFFGTLLIFSNRAKKVFVSILSSLYGQSIGIVRAFTDKSLGAYKPTNHL